MSDTQKQQIAAALEQVFRFYHEKAGPAGKDERTRDFVFHMTDWYDDLMELSAVYSHPKEHSAKEWNHAVFGFLIHAVGHLVQAARLNETFYDPFKTPPVKKPRKRLASQKAGR